jgi:hypothetical protein
MRNCSPSALAEMGEAMQQCAAVRTRELAELKLSGYVFKKHAPSCGVDRVRVDSSKNISARRGRGLFAAALMKKRPKKRDRLNNPSGARILSSGSTPIIAARKPWHVEIRKRWCNFTPKGGVFEPVS